MSKVKESIVVEHVELNGMKLGVKIPRRYVTRRLIAKMWAMDNELGCVAALGLCVPDLEVRMKLEACNYSIGQYAAAAWDELNGRGYEDKPLMKAGQQICLKILVDMAPNADEVSAEVDFSDPQKEAPTSKPSSSPTSGDSPTPTGSTDSLETPSAESPPTTG